MTQRLGLSENFLALFPILNAAVMLVFMVGIQHRLSATKFRAPLWLGLALYAVAALALIFSPPTAWLCAAVCVRRGCGRPPW